MDTGKKSTGSGPSDCQVLVVGAGPSGLVLAAELLARGIATRLVDKGDGVVLESRALAIHARTLEVLDSMGIAERFVDRGQMVRRLRMYTDSRPLVTLDFSLIGSRFGFMLDIPQDETQLLLRERVRELGGTIEQGTELLGFTQHEAGVTATVKDSSAEVRTITVDYLVGCDGAHSHVRHELGLTFQGHAYPQDWLLADVRLDWARPDREAHAFFRADGAPMICFPMRDHLWRLVLPYAGERDLEPPTLDEILCLVDQRAPQRIAVSDPTWLATFRCHRRSTNVYRRGRVLLAGDAVHIHTPAGGQGMNTGIMDAHNLAWKLALVASGRSSDALLDTYGQERAPVAAEVLRLTHALVQLGTMTHPVKRAVRDTVVPAAFRMKAIRRRVARRMSHHHVSYRSSSLTRPDRARGGPKPGDRAPDIDVVGLGGKGRLHQTLRGGRHVLLVSGADCASVLEQPDLQPYRDLLELVSGQFGGGRQVHCGSGGSVFLIRPDGYIAARGTRDRLPAVLDYLRQLFGPSERDVSMRPQRHAAIRWGTVHRAYRAAVGLGPCRGGLHDEFADRCGDRHGL